MSRCLAFNQKGRPCCNHGRVLSATEDVITYSPTCHAHRNYFKSKKNVDNWKILIDHKLFWYSFRCDTFISKLNILNILLAALQTGVVSLKETDLLVDSIVKKERDSDGYVYRRIFPSLK
jgi:hypothetical protein